MNTENVVGKDNNSLDEEKSVLCTKYIVLVNFGPIFCLRCRLLFKGYYRFGSCLILTFYRYIPGPMIKIKYLF